MAGGAAGRRSAVKAEIITLKVEPQLMDALRHVPNRSAFIRAAILGALENACPLCQGTGVLSPKQKEHWVAFAENHALQECRQCNELHLICRSEKRTRRPEGKAHQRTGRKKS